LTGRPPYTADSANDLLNKHLRAPIPSPKKINEKISPQFAEEVQRLLGKRPDTRPGSMQEVLEKLSSLKIYSNE
jgi:serine/threonine protein kinase